MPWQSPLVTERCVPAVQRAVFVLDVPEDGEPFESLRDAAMWMDMALLGHARHVEVTAYRTAADAALDEAEGKGAFDRPLVSLIPEKPAVTKTAAGFDSRQAIAEGWVMGERSDAPPYAIEKLDDPSDHEGNTGKTFDSDPDAMAFVKARAMAGSAYHQSALDFLLEHSPEGYAWVMNPT